MNIRKLGLTALLLSAALWCRPAGAQVNVNNQAELTALLQNWALSAETSIRLPAGDFIVDAIQLADGAGNIIRPLSFIGAGNNRVANDPNVTRLTINGAAQFKLGTLSFENLVLLQANIRATDSVPGLRSVYLHRVRVEGATIQVANGGGLSITSCCIVGGTFATQGPSNVTVERNTFLGGGINLSAQSTGRVNANLFDGVLPAGPFDTAIQGFNNYIKGNSDLGLPGKPEFALAEGETVPPEPLYTPDAGDWPGKLRFILKAKAVGASLSVAVTQDFEGDPISPGSPEIGADEVGLPFPTPQWTVCTISGPAGATLYDDANNTVPIVRGGVPINVAMTIRIQGASDLYRPKIEVVMQPEGIFDTTGPAVISGIVNPADLRANGADDIEFTFNFTPPADPVNFDGLAKILLRLDDSDVVTPSNITTTRANEFLVDSLPPLIPSGVGLTSVSSPDDASPTNCNSWTRRTDGTPDSILEPHFFFNAYPSLQALFTVNVEDQSAAVTRGNTTLTPETSGFLAAQEPLAGDVANTPPDALTGNSQFGTVSWRNNTVLSQGGTATASHSTGGTAGTDVTWTVSFPAQTGVPLARNWDADLIVTDRAGNSATVPLSTHFWWMPPNSTFANVTADSKDPASPSFSWELFLNGSSASAQQLPAECPSSAQFKVCRALVPSALDVSGWEEILDWTPATEAGAVGPNTVLPTGSGGSISLVELFRNYLGQTIIVIPRSSDPAGNAQTIPDLDVGNTTNLTLDELTQAGVSYAGPYLIPSRPPEGSLDTIVTTTLFLNRLDSGNASLWDVDSDETSYGAGPNVPLTPLRACNQRLEGQFLLDIAVPDNLPAGTNVDDLSVEYVVLEDGKVVATGNLYPRNANATARLMLPTDLIDLATGGSASPSTEFRSAYLDASFLNLAPQNCNRSTRDRLGDDGQVPRAGELDDNGRPLTRYRTRPVQYTVIFTATNDANSAQKYPDRDPDVLYDPTPTVVRFTVLPDLSNDSDTPPIKANSRP